MQLVQNLTKSQDSGPILITGHTGFKGSWLALLLKELGIRVVGLSLQPTPESLYARLDNSHYLREHFVDICDQNQVSRVLEIERPSIVFHLAAQPLVNESYINPLETFQTNVMGTINLLNAFSKLNSSRLFVGVTTDKVYKNDETGKRFKENDSLLGKDPYSASKVATENALLAWRHLTKVNGGPAVISVRAGNVIGGGDLADDRIVPDIIRGIINGQIVTIRNPKSTRPWQHVLDPLLGYIKAAEYSLNGGEQESFNFGPEGESLSVDKLVKIALNSGISPLPQIALIESVSGKEARTLQLDSSVSKQILGWKPRWSQELAIEDSCRWWDLVLNKRLTAGEACVDDIRFLLRGNRL
jgi:CDP-glucose 4,6-dehydratase